MDFTWKAHVERRPEDFVRNLLRLYLWRHTPDGATEVQMEGGAIHRISEGEPFPAGAGILLHSDQWSAIEAVVEPRAHNAELRRVEEALKVERERVDRLLSAANGRSE